MRVPNVTGDSARRRDYGTAAAISRAREAKVSRTNPGKAENRGDTADTKGERRAAKLNIGKTVRKHNRESGERKRNQLLGLADTNIAGISRHCRERAKSAFLTNGEQNRQVARRWRTRARPQAADAVCDK